MKTYRIQVKHDSGEMVLRVYARNIQAAKEMIMAAEGCPECAIGWIAIVPTPKQIQKTKNLLRSL
jgi:hypothetical protein